MPPLLLSIAIIHTPTRPERVANLARLLEQLPLSTVFADSLGYGNQQIANRRGCWPMARRAWIDGAWAQHHMVLEDDAVLCDGFLELVEQGVASHPAAVLSLFRGETSCSVATIMPGEFIRRWLPWADAESRIRPHHDQIIDIGCTELGAQHLFASPSIVEHGPLPSLLEHPPVRANRFEKAPSSVGWET